MKFAYLQVQNLELAQDIVQEAFARVWASARTPRPQPEFKRWLYRAITNLAIDHHRRERRMPTLVAADELRPVQGDEFERMRPAAGGTYQLHIQGPGGTRTVFITLGPI